MKKISFIFIILLTACNPKEKAENITLKNELKLLNDSVKKLNEEIVAKEISLDTLEQKLTNINNDLKSRNIFRINIDTLTFIYDVYRTVNLTEQSRILNTLSNNWWNIVEDYNINDKKWRNKEFLNSLFSNDMVGDLIVYLLKKDNIYEESDTRNYVNSLIDAYQTIEECDSIFLDDLYNLAKKNEDDEYYDGLMSDINSTINPYEAKLYYNEDRIKSFYLYTFWARRHQEDNKEIVYDLLKKLQIEMKKY